MGHFFSLLRSRQSPFMYTYRTLTVTPPPFPARITYPSKNGFDFQAWAAHGVPFLSREQEAHIQRKLLERRAREDEAAAVAAAIAEAGSSETASGEQAERPPHVTRDGTTLASLPLDEKTMILDARKKVFFVSTIKMYSCTVYAGVNGDGDSDGQFGRIIKSLLHYL